MTITRRHFLRALGIGTATAVVAPELLVPEEPRRRIWQVGRNAPVGLHQPVQLVDTGKLEPLPLWLDDSHGYTYDPTDALHVGDETALGDAQIKALLRRHPEIVAQPAGTLFGIPTSQEPHWNGNPVPRTLAGRMDIAERLLYPEPDPAAPFRMTVLKPRSPVVAVRTGGLFSSLTTEHADGSFVVHMPGAEDA